MNWRQRILSYFGASYFMFWDDNLCGFRVERAFRRDGYYWRKWKGKSRTSYRPLTKASMAKDMPCLVVRATDPTGGYTASNVWWTPLTKAMKAWYVMLEDEPST